MSSFLDKLKSFWTGIKKWTYKYIGSMFMEEKNGSGLAMSIGRVMLMILFFAMLWSWRRVLLADVAGPVEATLPDGMLACFYALLGYVLGGKGVKAIRNFRDGKITQEIELESAKSALRIAEAKETAEAGEKLEK